MKKKKQLIKWHIISYKTLNIKKDLGKFKLFISLNIHLLIQLIFK